MKYIFDNTEGFAALRMVTRESDIHYFCDKRRKPIYSSEDVKVGCGFRYKHSAKFKKKNFQPIDPSTLNTYITGQDKQSLFLNIELELIDDVYSPPCPLPQNESNKLKIDAWEMKNSLYVKFQPFIQNIKELFGKPIFYVNHYDFGDHFKMWNAEKKMCG